MARQTQSSRTERLHLPKAIAAEVEGWRQQGYHPFPSEATRTLLGHWFGREHDQAERFYPCQRQAIETTMPQVRDQVIAQQFHGSLFVS